MGKSPKPCLKIQLNGANGAKKMTHLTFKRVLQKYRLTWFKLMRSNSHTSNVLVLHECLCSCTHRKPLFHKMGASLEGVYPPWIFDCIIKITNLLKKLFKHPWARAANQKAWVIIYTLYTITDACVRARTHGLWWCFWASQTETECECMRAGHSGCRCTK